jgi:hypothetical protein
MPYDYVVVPTAGAFAPDELEAMRRWWQTAAPAAIHPIAEDYWLLFVDEEQRARRVAARERDRDGVDATTASVWLRPTEVSLVSAEVEPTDRALHAFVEWCLARFGCRFEAVGMGEVDPTVLLPDE